MVEVRIGVKCNWEQDCIPMLWKNCLKSHKNDKCSNTWIKKMTCVLAECNKTFSEKGFVLLSQFQNKVNKHLNSIVRIRVMLSFYTVCPVNKALIIQCHPCGTHSLTLWWRWWCGSQIIQPQTDSSKTQDRSLHCNKSCTLLILHIKLLQWWLVNFSLRGKRISLI